MAEGELGDRAADAPLDPLGPVGGLVLALALAPLLRAVGVADRHADDGDGEVRSADRHDAGDAAAGADDDVAADLLAQDAVRAADVARSLGRDGRRLQPEPALADGSRGLVHDLRSPWPGATPARGRSGEVELEADHVGGEDAQRLVQQLLPGVVPLQHRRSSRVSIAAECTDGLTGRWEGVVSSPRRRLRAERGLSRWPESRSTE